MTSHWILVHLWKKTIEEKSLIPHLIWQPSSFYASSALWYFEYKSQIILVLKAVRKTILQAMHWRFEETNAAIVSKALITCLQEEMINDAELKVILQDIIKIRREHGGIISRHLHSHLVQYMKQLWSSVFPQPSMICELNYTVTLQVY